MNGKESFVASKYRDDIVKLLDEPRTPNEIAMILKIHQNTAQQVLMELAVEGLLRHKKIGRFHLFWKKAVK
jgi:predicted ArsR family transcriptional regulator